MPPLPGGFWVPTRIAVEDAEQRHRAVVVGPADVPAGRVLAVEDLGEPVGDRRLRRVRHRARRGAGAATAAGGAPAASGGASASVEHRSMRSDL